MNNEIEKPSPDDVLAAIQSFNDPSIITNLFHELGWTYSFEIKETITMAKQNANLSIKFKAIKHLRELLREAAETSGLVANVSQSIPNAQGGMTTFHSKRIAGILNPTKQIESTEIKEPKNGKEEIPTKPNRDCDRPKSKRSLQADPLDSAECPRPAPTSERDGGLGSPEPEHGGETPRPVPGGGNTIVSPPGADDDSDSEESPCIKTRPPTCDRELFPGISSAGD